MNLNPLRIEGVLIWPHLSDPPILQLLETDFRSGFGVYQKVCIQTPCFCRKNSAILYEPMFIVEKQRILKRSELSQISCEKGVSFSEFAKAVNDCICATEMKPLNQGWILEEKNQVIYGMLDVPPRTVDDAKLLTREGLFSLAIRYSISGRYAPAFVCGAKLDIMGDSRLISLGEVGQRKRQFESYNLYDAVEYCISRFNAAVFNVQEYVDTLRKREITMLEGAGIVALLPEKGFMPYRHIPYVMKEFKEITADRKKISALNLWDSLQVSYEKLGITDQFNFLLKTNKVFETYLGITLPED